MEVFSLPTLFIAHNEDTNKKNLNDLGPFSSLQPNTFSTHHPGVKRRLASLPSLRECRFRTGIVGPVGKTCCSPSKTAKMVPSLCLQRWRSILRLSVTQRWFSNSLTFWASGDNFSLRLWGPSTHQLKASRLSLSPGTLSHPPLQEGTLVYKSRCVSRYRWSFLRS